MLARILREHRRPLVVLAIVLAANLVAYAAVVYPLSSRVADASRRAEAADAALRGARAELAAAQAVATGKSRAEAELATFYGEVLPRSLSAASRSTYLTIAQLARKTNLRSTGWQGSEEYPQGSDLGAWKIDVKLEGSYENIRRFVYELETTPTFVVIEQMSIVHGVDESQPLALSLALSTYFRSPDDAS